MASTSDEPKEPELSPFNNGVAQASDFDEGLFLYEKTRARTQQIMRHLVGQIMFGCKHSQCRKPYCHTGRANTTPPPVRHYTVCSARAVAVMLLTEPDWKKHCCMDHCIDDHPALLTELSKLPDTLDSQSMMQQLSHTEALSSPLADVELKKPDFYTRRKPEGPPEYYAWFDGRVKWLDFMFETPLTPTGKLNRKFMPDELAAGYLCTALEAYVDLNKLGQFDKSFVEASNSVTSGVDPVLRSESKWYELTRILDRPQYIGLCTRVCEALAYRLQLEAVLAQRIGPIPGIHGICTPLQKGLAGIMKTRCSPDDWATCSYLVWIKYTFLCYWGGDLTVKRSSIAYGALMLLKILFDTYKDSKDRSTEQEISVPSIARRLERKQAAEGWVGKWGTWLDHEDISDESSVHLLSLPWLHRERDILRWFRGTCAIRMYRATAIARTNEELTAQYMTVGLAAMDVALSRAEQLNHERGYYLALSVSRGNVVVDAFDQIWQRHASELTRPLKVRFGEENGMEVGQDLGGVQIEFLNALFSHLFKPDSGEFEPLPNSARLYYLRPGSPTSLTRFETIGLYMAIALYNGVAVPVSLPLAFYRLLLGVPCDQVDHISDGWPDTARFLGLLLQEKSNVDIEYAFPMEANGLRLSINKLGFEHLRDQIAANPDHKSSEPLTLKVSELSLMDNANPRQDPGAASDSSSPYAWAHLLNPPRQWPGWKIVPQENPDQSPMISDALKKPYIQDHVAWLTTYRVLPQLNAMRRGFRHIFTQHHLSMHTPKTLQLALQGRPLITIRELRAGSTVQGFNPDEQWYIEAFWDTIAAWKYWQLAALVKFVTAAARMPATEGFGFKIEKMEGGEEGRLPYSSTCFQTLFLPMYPKVIGTGGMEEKLMKAVEMGLGFGTA